MKWDIEDECDSRVIKATGWIPLKAYKNILEDRAGVYIFADNEFDVKYLGKAGAGRMVVENTITKIKEEVANLFFEVYSAIKRKKNTSATLVKALYTNSDAVALEYEQELIKKYTPPNNGVDLLKS
jgi:excinuclease UvrABC nuclease subunit